MATTDSTFLAEGSSNPNEVTGVTAWSRPAGNIPFEKGMFGIGVNWGVIGYIDDGTLQLKWPAVSYTGKAGVFGVASADTGAAGTSTTGVGVFGHSGNVTGLSAGWSCGVLGASAAKNGVIGWSSKSEGVRAFSNTGDGVKGTSEKGLGVYGFSINSTGVYGGSTTGKGMYGQSGTLPNIDPYITDFSSIAGAIAGVFGASRDAAGVFGVSQKHAGVRAINHGEGGWAAVEALSKVSPGMIGMSDLGNGVIGASNVGQGVYGYSKGNAGVVGESASPQSFGGYFFGNVHMTGTLTSDTVKGAVVPFPDGTKRLLVCMESPEPWFEDFGAGKLKRGRAVVKIDPNFAKVIKRDYHVFLTPRGDCHGLYVRRQGAAGFEVREVGGGTSNVAFSYRIVGLRKDIKRYKRFAKIDTRLQLPVAARAARKRASSRSDMRALFEALEKRRPPSIPAHGRRRSKRA